MAVPVVTTSTNKSSYASGEEILLTVRHSDADRKTITVTTEVTDSTGAKGSATSVIQVDPGVVTIMSVPTRVWTEVSNANGVAVFRTFA